MADIVNRERMEKKKAMDAALQTTSTVGGLQNLFQDLAQDALPEVSSHILNLFIYLGFLTVRRCRTS